MNARLLVVATAAGAALATGLAAPVQAAPRTEVVYSSSTYLPSAFAVSHGNAAFLACATVLTARTDGGSEPLPYTGCSAHVEYPAGVAYSPDGHLRAWTVSVTTPFPVRPTTSTVRVGTDAGDETSIATVSDAEYDHNPDGGATYGTSSASSCVQDALGADASYLGRLDTELSAVAAGTNGWYTADRDGNTIYRVSGSGASSKLAVLPPVKVKVSAALAKTNGWPSCVVGTKVAFEAAPTEIEVGPDGSVYVAGLPKLQSGRHAGKSVIYKINPVTGKVKRLSQSYAGRVDLAVGTRGRLFVARPDDGKITVIKKGRASTYLRLGEVESVETDETGRLYAARDGRTGMTTHDADIVRIG